MTEAVIISVMRLDGYDAGIPLPSFESDDAAGMDIRANFENKMSITLSPFERLLVPTGFAMALPKGYEAQIRPRSGLALKHGITLLNTPGTIDADYRGPIGIIMINLGQAKFTIEHGARVAQMVITPLIKTKIKSVLSLDETVRGANGFGSTGQK